ncbi:glycosyltransferase [Microvirga rosea]|uniref:glycosyltransferase n=1 Tax=Microvirga rosea TaxID=2715425 RepID=UPI001D0B05A0|nr:glycosyltransferase [Microvirga rosea]MCB8820138.1 glycosyl transferase family 28 [Microvirga rosea]
MSSRVLIVVTHLLGSGHLTRAASLARAFASAGHPTTLVSGGSPVPLPFCPGVQLVQLPPVRTIGTDFKTLLDADGRPITDKDRQERRRLLLETLDAVQPQVLITELFPFGRRVLAEEFEALLAAATALPHRPLIVSSIRDVLVAPARPERIAEAHRRIARFYDAVLVHGDPSIVPLDASWPVDGMLRPMLHDTGYVDEGSDVSAAAARNGIVVSGGSSASSLPVYRAALDAARRVPDRPWHILVGRGITQPDFEALCRDAPAHVTVERARPDFRALLARSELSVSQAGYNTCVDLLRAGVRSILIPFEAGHETEQRLRADRFAALGLASVIGEDRLSGEALAAAVETQLRAGLPLPPPISLDGARHSVAIIEALTVAVPPVHESIDWAPLGEALRRARDRGRAVRFWWRDDDAVAATPQLERLLSLSDRFQAGLALACVPMGLEPSLAQRLSASERAAALVHGLGHVNHAPGGEKKAEFGPHRPLETLVREAGDALVRSRAVLGDRLLPVFVPPWNRIAPALIDRLPQAGYSALSTFRDRDSARPVKGLTVINTHVDPIDWHGTRSLIDPSTIIRNLADAVERRVSGHADVEEPVGLLTHHLVHDERVWTFCENLLVYLSRNNESFVAINELFCNKNRIVAGP